MRRCQACADCVNLSAVRTLCPPSDANAIDFIEIRSTYSIAAAQLVPGHGMVG